MKEKQRESSICGETIRLMTERRYSTLKTLMLGNEAVARGLYEAGCGVVSSYPGDPQYGNYRVCGEIR